MAPLPDSRAGSATCSRAGPLGPPCASPRGGPQPHHPLPFPHLPDLSNCVTARWDFYLVPHASGSSQQRALRPPGGCARESIINYPVLLLSSPHPPGLSQHRNTNPDPGRGKESGRQFGKSHPWHLSSCFGGWRCVLGTGFWSSVPTPKHLVAAPWDGWEQRDLVFSELNKKESPLWKQREVSFFFSPAFYSVLKSCK